MNVRVSVQIESLSPEEIADRLRIGSVAYVPLGSLEFHGPHLPIGLDALTAHGVCIRAAEISGGVVLPPFYQSIGGEHTTYPWTIMSHSPRAIETLVTETLVRLNDFGVEHAVILSGHFASEQQDLVTRIVEGWPIGDTRRMAVLGRTLAQAPNPPVAPDHAGQFESLLLHAMDARLVNPTRLPDVHAFPAPSGEDPFGAQRHHVDHPLHGVFGPDPRHLDLNQAEPLLAYFAEWVAGLSTDAQTW